MHRPKGLCKALSEGALQSLWGLCEAPVERKLCKACRCLINPYREGLYKAPRDFIYIYIHTLVFFATDMGVLHKALGAAQIPYGKEALQSLYREGAMPTQLHEALIQTSVM